MKYNLKKERNDGDHDFIDQDGCSWNNPFDWLFIGILGGCGCGSSEYFGNEAFNLLKLFSKESSEENIYDSEFKELLTHWITSKGLLDHGSGISASWLTDEGKHVYNVIVKLIEE